MLDFFVDVEGTKADSRIIEEATSKVKSAKTNVPIQGDGKVDKIFIAIQSSLSPEIVRKTDAIFQFNVKGN